MVCEYFGEHMVVEGGEVIVAAGFRGGGAVLGMCHYAGVVYADTGLHSFRVGESEQPYVVREYLSQSSYFGQSVDRRGVVPLPQAIS